MRRTTLTVVCGVVFVDLLGFGVVLPQLPYFATDLGATGTWVGVLFTAYSAAQLLGSPVLGTLSDRHGRRPLLLMSLAGSALSLALTGVAQTLVLLLAARTFAGLCGGSISVAQAYVCDLVDGRDRTRMLGVLGAAVGLGFVAGPALGAALSPFGFATACFVAAGLAAGNLLLAWFVLPESLDPGAQRGSSRGRPRTGVGAAVRAALRSDAARPILGAAFLTMFAFTGMEATFALLGEQRFDLGVAGLGAIFAFAGAVVVVVQGGLVGPLAARLGDQRLAVCGAAIMAASLAVVPILPALGAYLAVGMLAAGYGMITPALTSMLAGAGGESARGGTLGVAQSASAAARAVGPTSAGVLFDAGSALPYLVGAVLCLIGAGLVARVVLDPPRDDETAADVPDRAQGVTLI